MQNSSKGGFLLANELKKWKNNFLTHGWEYAFEGGGIFSSVCFCCHPPLPDVSHPTALRVFLGCFRIWSSAVVLFFLYLVSVSCQPFISYFCAVILVNCGVDTKGWAACLAWNGTQLCVEIHVLLLIQVNKYYHCLSKKENVYSYVCKIAANSNNRSCFKSYQVRRCQNSIHYFCCQIIQLTYSWYWPS